MLKLGNVLIIGDSYSTFKDCIPQGYETWYPNPETDVENVEQTWWKQLISDTESNLVLNNSWSGTTVGNTGYGGSDCTKTSFIGRFDELANNGFFKENKIDTLFIFGGTNDSWSDAPIGEIKESDWEREDLFKILPAFSYLLHRIKEELPDAKTVCTLNTELKTEITDNFKLLCDKNAVTAVVLKKVDKIASHPSVVGMRKIKEQVIEKLIQE